MAQDEKITEQQVTSEESSIETEQQTLDISNQDQSVQADGIPEKFIGKTVAEVAAAYKELQTAYGRQGTELGQSNKEREDFQEKWRLAERQSMQHQPIPTQISPQQSVQPQQDLDPVAVLDARFDDDPKEALKEALRIQNKRVNTNAQQQVIEQRGAEATQWYYKQKQENQDYARREPLMQQAASQFGHLISPEYRNSVQALQFLDLISKGMDVNYYSKQAVTKAQEDGLSVREEKRRAQSESSTSDGESTRAFESLSLEEMEKYLGEADE